MQQEKQIILLPDRAYARRQMAYNSLWFALFAVLAVAVAIVISFPKFFLVELPQYKAVLFQEGTAGNDFFVKLVISLGLLFVVAAVTRYYAIYVNILNKKISVNLSNDGISSRCGYFERKISWNEYGRIVTTDFPLRLKFGSKKLLFVHSVFNEDSLRKKIADFKKSL